MLLVSARERLGAEIKRPFVRGTLLTSKEERGTKFEWRPKHKHDPRE